MRYRTGATAASSDSFHIHVKGKGTHGAMPWGGTDAVTTAAQIVVSLQSIVSRRLDLTANPAMISVGSLQAGNRPNIIPSDAELQGTIRAFSENDRTLIHELVGDVSHSVAKSYGTEADVRVMKGYPVVVNDTALGAVSSPVLVSLVGDGFTEAPRGTGSEDFGFFAAEVPGFFFGLGAAPVNGSVHMNHSPYFDIDEEALTIGVQALSRLAVHYHFLHQASR